MSKSKLRQLKSEVKKLKTIEADLKKFLSVYYAPVNQKGSSQGALAL